MYPGRRQWPLVGRPLFVCFSPRVFVSRHAPAHSWFGLGWSAASVASTALICRLRGKRSTAGPRQSASAESGGGANDGVLPAVVTGPLVECTSLPAAGIVAVLIAVVPAI